MSCDSVKECVLWKRNSCGETWWSIDCLILRLHGRILVARGPTHEYPLAFHETSRDVHWIQKTHDMYTNTKLYHIQNHTNITAHILQIVMSWCNSYISAQKHLSWAEASRCLKTLRLLLAPALDRCKAPGFFGEFSHHVWLLSVGWACGTWDPQHFEESSIVKQCGAQGIRIQDTFDRGSSSCGGQVT